MSNSSSTPFRASVALVLEQVGDIKELRRSTRTKLLQFAIDTCLVAHGVRTGYLVDALCPPNPRKTLVALLMALRAKSPVFQQVMLWYHTPLTQSFLVHVPLVQDRFTALLDEAGDCVLIKLDKCPSMSRELPDRLQQAIHDMRFLMTESPDALSLPLPDALTAETLVPLAAVMIDYPVAYFPASSVQTSFLTAEALNIYTVSVRGITPSDFTSGLGEEHVLLKFSSPQALVSNHAELSPSAVIKKLRVKFTARLGRIGQISVHHRTQTVDRVAL